MTARLPSPFDIVTPPGAEGWQGKAIKLLPDSDSLDLTSKVWKEYLGIAVYHAARLL